MYVSLVKEAQSIIAAYIKPGDITIDATVGNGLDTQFLASRVGPAGHVYGFDIQAQALQLAKERMQGLDLHRQVTLITASHEFLSQHIPKQYFGRVKAVMFNLGYLPGSNKSVVTQSKSTLASLTRAREIVAQDGVISILAYAAHAGGNEELQAVQDWLSALDKNKLSLEHIQIPGPQKGKPQLFILRHQSQVVSG